MEGNLGVLSTGAQERTQGAGAVFPKRLPENFLEQGEKRNQGSIVIKGKHENLDAL